MPSDADALSVLSVRLNAALIVFIEIPQVAADQKGLSLTRMDRFEGTALLPLLPHPTL